MNLIGKADYGLIIFSEKENYKEMSSEGTKQIIQRIEPTDCQRREVLEREGFSFLDRIFSYEINSDQTREMRNKTTEKLLKFPMYVSSELTEEMLNLACDVYTTDRRFHLKKEFDQNFANRMIEEYFKAYSKMNPRVFSCRIDDKLVGFTVVISDDKGCFENLIGVTERSLIGKMIAYRLYDFMLNEMSENGFTKYRGCVSTTNLASNNLHIQLGGRIVNIYDEYILRKGEN